jgi:hypothetical protein
VAEMPKSRRINSKGLHTPVGSAQWAPTPVSGSGRLSSDPTGKSQN